MNAAPQLLGRTGLQFFGTMTASISHEIKNVLAIINENAGLMKDLVLMAEQGRPLDLTKVKTIADRFSQQVTRADHIVKNLNQFAHSSDQAVKPVDIANTISLALSLAGRFISMKNISFNFTPPENSSELSTDPFFLTNFLWFGIEDSINFAGKNPAIQIECNTYINRIDIIFNGLSGLSEDTTAMSLFSKKGELIANYLDAVVEIDHSAQTLAIGLPRVLKNQ